MKVLTRCLCGMYRSLRIHCSLSLLHVLVVTSDHVISYVDPKAEGVFSGCSIVVELCLAARIVQHQRHLTTRSTQPCIPQVPALLGLKVGMSSLPDGR